MQFNPIFVPFKNLLLFIVRFVPVKCVKAPVVVVLLAEVVERDLTFHAATDEIVVFSQRLLDLRFGGEHERGGSEA